MSIAQQQLLGSGPNDNVFSQVDPSHKSLRVSVRPLEHGTGGEYRFSSVSRAVTGVGVTAGGVVFACKFTTAGMRLAIMRLRAYWLPTTVFTAAQELGLDFIHANAFPLAYTAGTAITTPTPMRKGMPTSSFANPNSNDMRICPATILTAPGTLPTFDQNPIDAGSGVVDVANAAAGTAYVNAGGPGGTQPAFGFDYYPNMSDGEHPLVIESGEGFVIRNTVVFPAAGACSLFVMGVLREIVSADGIL